MKRTLLICICIISTMLLGACACADEKHITQSQAEEIAEDLVGGEVTFVETKKDDDRGSIYYIFTDSKGITFTITSGLSKGQIDGATAEFLPFECHVFDDYDEAVLIGNQDKIMEILESYGLDDYLQRSNFDLGSIDFDINLGTPEENQEILKKITAAGVEIDALLDITYDIEYGEKTKDEYFSYGYCAAPYMHIEFIEKLENQDRKQRCVDIATPDFSVSDDSRWTADSLYKAIKDELEDVEIAE